MQYPFVIFSEWKPTNDPLFYKTKNGDEYCVLTISKTFSNNGNPIRDAARIQCFGDECEKVRYLMKKNNGSIKGLPLDVFADIVPFDKGNGIQHSYNCSKISIASSFYAREMSENQKKGNDMPDLIRKLDSEPFGIGY